MSKITFRADDDLIEQLEAFDASKSEVMREALRAYLGEPSVNGRQVSSQTGSLDELVAERVDAVLSERLDDLLGARSPAAYTSPEMPDINVNVTLDGVSEANTEPMGDVSVEHRKTRDTSEDLASDDGGKQCNQCGENMSQSHVYCPNCGGKASNRIFCECGDEIRSDWSFCPGCGRRTAAADVLDRS